MDTKTLIIFLICLGNAAISFNVGAVAAAIPLISADLQLADIETAQLISFYMIPYGIGALLYAPLTRFITYRLIMMAAMALYAIFSLMTAVAVDIESMLLAQIGAGIAAACSTPLSLMIIGDLFDKDVRGRMIGIYFGTSFVASMVGMVFMGVFPWRLLFFVPCVIATLTTLLMGLCKIEALDRVHQAHINYLRVFVQKDLVKVFVFIFMMSFLYHGLHKWYGVYLSRVYDLPKETISFFLIIAACCGLIGQNIGGFLTDKKGRQYSCFFGGLLLALGAMSLWGFYLKEFLPVILGIIAIGWTINHNAVSTILTDMEDHNRPMIASLNSSVRFFSGGLGFALAGVFVDKNFGLTFFIIGFLFLMLTLNQKKFFGLKF